MESVRITRWILAPWPTFRLWRRMKLWELRSYDEVIRLEQQRLVYQAYLKVEFGRNWKRRAPVEVLMPLRLARFGVPLAGTVPAALESVGLPVPDLFLTGQGPQPTPGTGQARAPEPAQHATAVEASAEASQGVEEHDETAGASTAPEPAPQQYVQPKLAAVAADGGLRAGAVQARVGEDGAVPRIGHAQTPVPYAPEREAARQRVTVSVQRGFDGPPANVEGPDEAENTAVAVPGAAERRPKGAQLTTGDRYFRAWSQYVQSFGTDPGGDRLSEFLTQRGFTGRGGGAVSLSTLRRYLPEFRAYAAWQHVLEDQGKEPTADELALVLAERGNSGAAYTVAKLQRLLDDFPRRRAALASDWADSNT
jgi:hypothetical protein